MSTVPTRGDSPLEHPEQTSIYHSTCYLPYTKPKTSPNKETKVKKMSSDTNLKQKAQSSSQTPKTPHKLTSRRRSQTLTDLKNKLKSPPKSPSPEVKYVPNEEFAVKYYEKLLCMKCFRALFLNHWRKLRENTKELKKDVEESSKKMYELLQKRKRENEELFCVKAQLKLKEEVIKDTLIALREGGEFILNNLMSTIDESHSVDTFMKAIPKKISEILKVKNDLVQTAQDENQKIKELEIEKENINEQMMALNKSINEQQKTIRHVIIIHNDYTNTLNGLFLEYERRRQLNEDLQASLEQAKAKLKEAELNYSKCLESKNEDQAQLRSFEAMVAKMSEHNLYLNRRLQDMQAKQAGLELLLQRIVGKSWSERLLDVGRIPLNGLLDMATKMLPALSSMNITSLEEKLLESYFGTNMK